MRRTLSLALLTVLLAPPVLGQSAELIERYEADRATVRELVGDLTPEQWSFKPAPDRWSIAEVLEHVIVNEKIVWGVLTEQLTDVEVSDESRAQSAAFEEQIASTLRNRGQRFQAPETLEPTGRWAGGDEVVGMFKEVRGGMLRWLSETDFDLRTKQALNPVIQMDMDAHTWAVVTVEHSARHQQQILEVMEDAGFPGR